MRIEAGASRSLHRPPCELDLLTPSKWYVARLRLERAAFRLLIHDRTLLDIALDCGFQSHETFTRAFRRRFGMPPSSYRAWVRTQAQQWKSIRRRA